LNVIVYIELIFYFWYILIAKLELLMDIRKQPDESDFEYDRFLSRYYIG